MNFSQLVTNNTLGTHNQTQFDNSVLFLYYMSEQLHEESVHREVKRLQSPFV